MAVVVADEGVIQIDNASDALQDYSTDVDSWQLALNINGSTYHTMSNRWAKALEGGVGGTLTLSYLNDTTATELAGIVRAWMLHATAKGGARSVRLQVPDATSGSTQYDFEVRLGGNADLNQKTAGAGDPEKLSLTLNVDGAITASTIA